MINIGKYFLRLIDKHFNGNKPLKKIFIRKTIKISYSCPNSLYKIISNHNRNLIENPVLIDKVCVNHYTTAGLEKNVLLVVNVIPRM